WRQRVREAEAERVVARPARPRQMALDAVDESQRRPGGGQEDESADACPVRTHAGECRQTARRRQEGSGRSSELAWPCRERARRRGGPAEGAARTQGRRLSVWEQRRR